MTKLITFFMGGPARIQGLLIGLLAVAVACLALTAWALWERSGKLSALVDVATLKGDLGVCNGRVEHLGGLLATQNAAVARYKGESDQAQAAGRRERDKAATLKLAKDAEIDRLTALLSGQKGNSCPDAWRDIAEGGK